MGLKRAVPGATFWTDSSFVFQGVRERGRLFRCSSRAAWANIWKLARRAIEGRRGLDQLRLLKVKAHTDRFDALAGVISARAQVGSNSADVPQASRRVLQSFRAVSREVKKSIR
eukprot:6659867-Pyramimonas_sp.AAC.1